MSAHAEARRLRVAVTAAAVYLILLLHWQRINVLETVLIAVAVLELVIELSGKGPIAVMRRRYRRPRAFEVTANGDLEAIPLGASTYRVIVSPWKRVTIYKFNIRFVWTTSTSRDAPPPVPASTIHVSGCKLIARSGEKAPVGVFMAEDRGGYTFTPDTPFDCSADVDLILNIQIQAHKRWYGGLLSFEADIGQDKKYYGRTEAQTDRAGTRIGTIEEYNGPLAPTETPQVLVAPKSIPPDLPPQEATGPASDQEDQGGVNPRFHIDISDSVKFFQVNMGTPDGPGSIGVLCTVHITNEGSPGRLRDLRGWLNLEGRDELVAITNFDLDDHRFHHGIQGEISREHLIWERVAALIQTGETLSGYYVGLIPEEYAKSMDEPLDLVIACRDYKGRVFQESFPTVRRPMSGHSIQEPTLPVLRLDESFFGESLAKPSTPDTEEPPHPEPEEGDHGT